MRRRHRRLQGNADLDITAFLNLMIVLVPVLLLGMVFTQLRIIDLNFPGMTPGEVPDEDRFQLEVLLVPTGLQVADSERGIIESFPRRSDEHNYEGLQESLKLIKKRMPDKTDLTLRVGPDVDYQSLVNTIDAVRSYPGVVAASVVQAELFPDVALGDAPAEAAIANGDAAAAATGTTAGSQEAGTEPAPNQTGEGAQ